MNETTTTKPSPQQHDHNTMNEAATKPQQQNHNNNKQHQKTEMKPQQH